MPPKKALSKGVKAKAAKAPPRKPATSKPKTQGKGATKAAPPPSNPPATAKKRKATSDPQIPRPPTPEWDKNILSKAQREKRRFKISRASMNEDISEEDLLAITSSFTGFSQETWGILQSEPIMGSRRPIKRARGPFSFKRGGDEFQQTEDAYALMMAHMKDESAKKREVSVNCPTKSGLLRVPLEVRERIYGYVLICPKPIMVKEDWTTPERNPFMSHALMFVCKLFAHECTSFLFKNNRIVSLLRAPAYQVRRYEEVTPIPDFALTLYRNVILDCSYECWNLDWFEKATLGLQKLRGANAFIESLTLRFSPQRVGVSSTALGLERRPITFADFLWFEGAFMQAVLQLSPQTLILVTNKGGRVRLKVKVDMKGIRATKMVEVGLLTNEQNLRAASERLKRVKGELNALKGLYEEIFEDHEKVVREGRCQLLDDKAMISRPGERAMEKSSPSPSQSRLEPQSDIEIAHDQSSSWKVDDSPWVFGIPGSIAERFKI